MVQLWTAVHSIVANEAEAAVNAIVCTAALAATLAVTDPTIGKLVIVPLPWQETL